MDDWLFYGKGLELFNMQDDFPLKLLRKSMTCFTDY